MPEILYLGDGGTLAPDQFGQALLAFDVWRAALAAGQSGPAVSIAPDDDFEALAPHLADLRLIALEFPKGDDGRAYSIATLLRTRHGYRGELRAIGDVRIDQLFFMLRVGFDSAQLRAELTGPKSMPAIRRALATFSERYQNATDEPLPLFKRRLLGDVRAQAR